MAKKVDVKLVTGQVKTLGTGQRISSLPDEIKKALQAYYDNPAIENVEVTPEVRWDTAASGGNALLIVTFDEKSPPKSGK